MIHFPKLLLHAYSNRKFSAADGQLILGVVAAFDLVFRAESKYPVPLYQSMQYVIVDRAHTLSCYLQVASV